MDLHKEMPVVCLKGFETIQKLVKDIGDIYTHLFAKHKFLILIDENDFSTKQMQELENGSGQRICCEGFVCKAD